MASKPSQPAARTPRAPRAPRADARRNRARILEVAKEVFTRSGASASLDDIAKQAGVGPGTLYRHFPARVDLLAAVYQAEVDNLAAAGRSLAQAMPPLAALRAWLLLFVDAMATKKIIAPALNSMTGGAAAVIEACHVPIQEAIRALVRRAIKSGDIRPDINPIDILGALVGVASLAISPDWQPSARRLVDILITGARTSA